MGACACAPVTSADELAVVGVGSREGCARRYTKDRRLEDDYEVTRRVLGCGMSGEVKLAIGRWDRCAYAVKSFSKRKIPPSSRADLKSEAEIYLSLDHPHIVRLDMVYESKDEMHFVMEQMEGGELFDRIAGTEEGVYSEREAMEATRQMLLALVYIHSCGIAHRDLKLENFLYEQKTSNHLKLADFGLSKFVDKGTTLSTPCGSLQYIAPEVLGKAYTNQADMWSMGVIVYLMLVGRMLWSGSDGDIQGSIRRGDLAFSPRFMKLSALAQDFVQSLLVVDVDQRLTASQALLHPWLQGGTRTELPMNPTLLGSLRRNTQASPFQRKVRSMLAWSSATEERSELRQHFLAMDQDKSGTISLQEFRLALEQEALAEEPLPESEAEELFRNMDSDGSDGIEYSEFLAAAMPVWPSTPEDVRLQEGPLRRTFARFDLNGDGKLSLEEVSTVLGESFSSKDLEELFEQADTSGDGELDFDEFSAHFRNSGHGAVDAS